MMPIGHFSVGVISGIILRFVFHAFQGINLTAFLFICGFIAMLPDIGYLWKDYHLDDHWFMNIFFFHNLLDQVPDEAYIYPSLLFSIAFLLVLVVI